MKSLENANQQQAGTADKPFPYQRGWGGNAHNTALAEVAAAEDEDPDGILIEYHTIELACAPMFALLLDEYKERVRLGPDNVSLAMFGARLFMAGQRSRDRGDAGAAAPQGVAPALSPGVTPPKLPR